MDQELQANASQEESGFFDVDALSRAAEEAKAVSENTPTESDQTPSQEVSDEVQQEVAFQDVQGEQPTEPPPEPADNKERSQLGRKVSFLEKQLSQTSQQLQQMTELMSIFVNQSSLQGQQQTQQEEDEYVPTDKRSLADFVANVVAQKERVQHQAQEHYERGYFGTLQKIETAEVQEDGDDALHNEVVKLITSTGSKFNRRHSDNPALDASTNYYAAKSHILKQRLSRPKPPVNPLKGNPPKAALGASPSASTAAVKHKVVKLGPEARRMANAFNFSSDELSKMGFE